MKINTHKDFVKAIKTFKVKMGDFLESVAYVKSDEQMIPIFQAAKRRALLVNPMTFEVGNDGDYNHSITYGVTVIDTVTDDEEVIVESEDTNLFVINALHDYLNYVNDADVSFMSGDIERFGKESDITTTLSCKVTLNMKAKPTAWSKLR